MYRRDATRSGFCPATVPAELQKAWTVQLGGRLTQPIVAGGKVFVVAVDRHTLYAMDSDTGTAAWQYTAGGRIDSAPTVYRGTILFGSADGWVYCLRADDGSLAWRYLVAPGEKRIVSYDQVESAWPVSGSVLVQGDVVYALAGRNMFFDGGLRLVRLDSTTGKLLSETIMDENDPRTGENLQTLIVRKYMPVANADLLSCDGQRVYMQTQKFDLDGRRLGIAPSERDAEGGRHLFCQTGLLDDLWFHRSYWIYGETCGEGWGAYANTRKNNPCGRIMVLDDSRAYAFRSEPLGNMLHPRTQYRLYAADKDPVPASPKEPARGDGKKAQRTSRKKVKGSGGFEVHWELESLPLLVKGEAHVPVVMGLGACQLFSIGHAEDNDLARPHAANEQLTLGAVLCVRHVPVARLELSNGLQALPVEDPSHTVTAGYHEPGPHRIVVHGKDGEGSVNLN